MFTGVSKKNIPQIWPYILPLIEKGVRRSFGKTSSETYYQKLLKGDMQLWVYKPELQVEMITITALIDYPEKRSCHIALVSGQMRKNWMAYTKTIEQWAISKGCQSIEAQARKGWMKEKKLKDWQLTQVILEKKL